MWLEIVQDTKFFDLLLAIDADLAAEVRQRGCQECGGPLHQANYPRKPRGGIDLEDAKRWSLCCGREGCRKRHLPSSVVYLGRRVYYGVVLVLVMAMREGLTAKRVAKLRKELGVSRQTLARWRSWWRAHGKSQSYLKRGLPRREMSDNGGAMLAEETQRAYERLGILHETTLPESPHQNAKAEKFWDTLEERLMAMLEGVENLTLELLNRATQAWVEREYNRRVHSELGVSPLHRYLHGKSLGRPSPDAETLRRAFRVRRTRTQRRSDGTISLQGQRFEIPSQYRTMTKIHIEFARWDLRHVDMVDPRTGGRLCPIFPLDRRRNADGRRRRLADVEPGVQPDAPPAKSGMAPLLKQLITEYEASGLPPSFLPMNPTREHDITEDTEDTHTIQEDHDEDEPA